MTRGIMAAAALAVSALALAPSAQAQVTLGGHVGFVLPLVTHAGGQTTNLADNFSI